MKLEDLVHESVIVVGSSHGPVTVGRTFTRVIGTSGSMDYLLPERDARRFWPVKLNREAVATGDASEME